MKNRGFFLFLISFLSLSACSRNKGGENSPGLTPEDKAYPGASQLNYNEYFDLSEIDESKFFYNKNHALYMPDPFVLKEGDTYYIYGTTDR